MIFCELYSNQFKEVEKNKNATRSSKLLIPIHSEIASIVKTNTNKYQVISMPESEYCFNSDIGSKKVDIAIIDDQKKLKGAIMFKGIRAEYNKNANNYYENMKGESSLFIDNNIPVYQIIFIPTQIKHKKSTGEQTFESPTSNSYNNYYHFINHKTNYWEKLKLGVYYFDIDYNNDYQTTYSKKRIEGVEKTLTQGLINFVKGVEQNG